MRPGCARAPAGCLGRLAGRAMERWLGMDTVRMPPPLCRSCDRSSFGRRRVAALASEGRGRCREGTGCLASPRGRSRGPLESAASRAGWRRSVRRSPIRGPGPQEAESSAACNRVAPPACCAWRWMARTALPRSPLATHSGELGWLIRRSPISAAGPDPVQRRRLERKAADRSPPGNLRAGRTALRVTRGRCAPRRGIHASVVAPSCDLPRRKL